MWLFLFYGQIINYEIQRIIIISLINWVQVTVRHQDKYKEKCKGGYDGGREGVAGIQGQ